MFYFGNLDEEEKLDTKPLLPLKMQRSKPVVEERQTVVVMKKRSLLRLETGKEKR